MVNGMRTGRWVRSGLGALSISLAVLIAPAAAADPADSGEPVPQVVVDVSPAPAVVSVAPVPAVVSVAPVPAVVAPAPAAPVAVSTVPANGVPHLPSPENLPPGTTQDVPEGPKMSYLRYLWQAIRTPGVTAGDALMLIAQRPMDATSTPPSSPTGPLTSAAEPVTVAPASP